MTNIPIAVITGGHAYDVISFHQLFRHMPGVDAYVQHLDDFSGEPAERRDAYAVLVFYTMFTDPSQDVAPRQAARHRAALERLGQAGQGIVILHHALLAYPDWPAWDEIVGIPGRDLRSYQHGERIRIELADPQHPIVQGVAAWEMTDETYDMPSAGADSHLLLTTEHPRCMRTIAWTRQYRQRRVFCFQSGHDQAAFADPSFQRVLAGGVRWCAGII